VFLIDSGGWTVTVWPDAGTASFAAAPHAEDHTARYGLPRVWPGRGLGVSAVDLPGLGLVLGEVMKTTAYLTARQEWHVENPGHAGHVSWGQGRLDDEDDFVYFTGPSGAPDGTVGYRPAPVFTLPLAEVRGLRVQVSSYLAAEPRTQVPGPRTAGARASTPSLR
jgi:hypothetical protein